MKKILIVDDEVDLVITMTFRLEAAGYKVLKAYDGKVGLDLARKEKPDLILLDVMLPRMDGYQVCKMLKLDDEYKTIPIIMLTARGQDVDKDIGYASGSDIYITKPFDAPELLGKIKELISE